MAPLTDALKYLLLIQITSLAHTDTMVVCTLTYKKENSKIFRFTNNQRLSFHHVSHKHTHKILVKVLEF